MTGPGALNPPQLQPARPRGSEGPPPPALCPAARDASGRTLLPTGARGNPTQPTAQSAAAPGARPAAGQPAPCTRSQHMGKPPWAPPPPDRRTGGQAVIKGPCPPPHPGAIPKDGWNQGARGCPPWLRPPCTVPGVRACLPSALKPSWGEGQAPDPARAAPGPPPVPPQRPSRARPCPLSTRRSPARRGTALITCRRPSVAGRPPVRQCPPVLPRCAAGRAPEGRPLVPKIKPARPSDLSAGALALPLTGKHLPEAQASRGQRPSSAGGAGPQQGSPGAPWARRGLGVRRLPGAQPAQSGSGGVHGAPQAQHQPSLQRRPAASRRCPHRCPCTRVSGGPLASVGRAGGTRPRGHHGGGRQGSPSSPSAAPRGTRW